MRSENLRAGLWPGRLWRYGPLLIWLGFIFFASTGEFSAEKTSYIVRPLLLWLFPDITEARLQLAHFLVRKLAHFTEYAILALLAARAFMSSSRDALARHWFAASLLLVVLYAFTDEFHQTFVPARTGSIYDSLIDSAGGLTALIVYHLLLRRRRRASLSGH